MTNEGMPEVGQSPASLVGPSIILKDASPMTAGKCGTVHDFGDWRVMRKVKAVFGLTVFWHAHILLPHIRKMP